MSAVPDAVTLVAGNGLSLATIRPGQVLASDRVIRCNNFFFEPRYYLGRRVDLAFVGGDPRVAPFVLETMHRARAGYAISAWSASHPKVIRAAQRRLDLPYRPFCYANRAVAAQVEALQARYQARLSTGLQAVLLAHATGAKRLLLAGIDLYSGAQRYAYAPGRHQRALLGQDLARRGADLRLHHPDLDRAMLAWLAQCPDMAVQYCGQVAALQALLDPAPDRVGPRPDPGGEDVAKPVLDDWVDWAGWYPISALKVLRRVRAWQRQLQRWRQHRSESRG